VYLCAAILRPFFNVIAWSSIFAISFYPLHQWLVAKTGRPSLSALVSSVLVVFAILIPLLIITVLAVNQFLALRDYLNQVFADGFDIVTFEPVRRASEWLVRRAGLDPARILATIGDYAGTIGGLAAGYSLAFATNITGAIVSFFFVVFALFFLFRDGTSIARRIPDFLPFDRPQSEALLERIRDVIYASVYGVLVIAAIQGLLIGLSFTVLGIPSAALWGVVTLFTSIIPLLGAGAVWVPGAVYLLLSGHWVQAIILTAWGGVIISSVDNFLRPKLVGGRVGLNELVMFFAVLGGLQLFGILGLVIGPVVFAVAGSILAALSDNAATPRTSS
jgi:predicted PurR-regulated permease PerM